MPLAEAWEIVTTTEPEWDDAQRDRMLALSLYRDKVCRQCGYHESLHHPRYHFAVELDYCPIRAALDRFKRIQDDAAEKRSKGAKPLPSVPQPYDGQQTVVRLKAPGESLRTSALR